MNTQNIIKQMSDNGWQFRNFVDAKQTHRMVGKFEDWGCLVDSKKDILEYWNYNFDYFVEYQPEIFSQSELELELLTCDSCRLIQDSMDDLQLVNATEKWCKKCCNCA